MRLGQRDAAIIDYNAILRIDPKNARALYGRGLAKRAKGDVAGGNADMAAGRAIQSDVAEYFPK